MEKNHSVVEIARAFNDSLEILDKIRIDEIKNQFENLEISKSNLEGHHNALKNKFGEGSIFLSKMKSRNEFENKSLESLKLFLEEEELTIPPITKNTFRIHGRIFEKDKILENVSLTFVDESKKEITELGEVLTDEKGYFSVELPINEESIEKFKNRSIFIVVHTERKRLLDHPIIPSKNLSSYIDIDLKKNDHLKILRPSSTSKVSTKTKK